MLDNYIQGFEEARQFIQHHYDALPMQNNANRFKHGNRCPQGEYWVQPPGKKGFCRAIGKRKGEMSNPQSMQVQKKRKLTWQNRMTSRGSQAAGKLALIGLGGMGTTLLGTHLIGKALIPGHTFGDAVNATVHAMTPDFLRKKKEEKENAKS